MKAFVRDVHPIVAQDMTAFLAKHWPQLGPNLDLQCSPYSMTKDTDFVLGRLPGMYVDIPTYLPTYLPTHLPTFVALILCTGQLMMKAIF